MIPVPCADEEERVSESVLDAPLLQDRASATIEFDSHTEHIELVVDSRQDGMRLRVSPLTIPLSTTALDLAGNQVLCEPEPDPPIP